MDLMMNVKSRQMMGVRIWQMLVPICLDCKETVLKKRARSWLEFFYSLF